jgi:hypothetical protein
VLVIVARLSSPLFHSLSTLQYSTYSHTSKEMVRIPDSQEENIKTILHTSEHRLS